MTPSPQQQPENYREPVLRLRAEPRSTNAHGRVHAGWLMFQIDTAGAICNAGIGRVVFGLDDTRLLQIRPDLRGSTLDCHTVFDNATYAITCIGPALVNEALAVYEDSWFPPSS